MNYLYFKADRACGYSLQLKINLDNKTYIRGYCIAAWTDFIVLKSKKELYKLCDELTAAGYKQIEE